MSLSLSGCWRLKKKGSDYVPGIDDIAGVPFISQMVDESHKLTITQLSRPMEEFHVVHEVGNKRKQCYYQLGKINFESITSSVAILASVVHISPDFKEVSILRMGPDKGQRSLEQYKLHDSGNEIRIEVDHVLPEGQALKLVKRLERIPESFVSETIEFSTISVVNNWAMPKSHAPSTLRSVRLRIIDCIQVITEGVTSRRASVATDPRRSEMDSSPPASPTLARSNSSLLSGGGSVVSMPRAIRRFNGELSSGETVQLYIVEVSVGTNTWRTYYRYREFDALRQFLSMELKDRDIYSSLPPFPPKTMGRIRGKSLEQRKEMLEQYIGFICSAGGYNVLNVVDAMCSFLEIPEHTLDAMAIPQAQAVLRQQMLGNFPSFDSQPELYPKHVLSSILGDGLKVLKYGRHGKPKERIIFRGNDENVGTIYWVEDSQLSEDKGRDAAGLPHGARGIALRSVREIRRGTAVDPHSPEFCGTPTLRKNCHPADYAYCVSLICADRTLDFKMLSREDYDAFVPNLLKHHEALIQNDGGAFNDVYTEVVFRS
mmetsp:Transcript_24717/g.36438  ORF Transcript_24717/g.36438 Transcript_24717/m.36438 type:complete len:544 (-) Transcript_24717:141-1772(-)|eukprot:CAMPEP_0185031046 /NCGR_PEP_ID=MMETSP1103-20130426/18287_1 /TAXON_ID=36769 /ORGANISM="Paraphysomonas bandaiensis, Strain Caron Lab Isolate" /LENGTH=543 /DNA_ID=CAMNT_0027566407 /DNA_START=124 /DNA_END=1755 /DNA_ORIENTATION=+